MTTSNTDLKNIALKLKLPPITICYDEELTNMKLKNGYYVLNLGGEKQNGGTHWVALAIRNKGKEMLYFDSFGVIWSNSVTSWTKYCSKKGYNTHQIQDINSNLCGWYCLMFFKFIEDSKYDMYTASNEFINLFGYDNDGNGELLKMIYLDKCPDLNNRLKKILLNDYSFG